MLKLKTKEAASMAYGGERVSLHHSAWPSYLMFMSVEMSHVCLLLGKKKLVLDGVTYWHNPINNPLRKTNTAPVEKYPKPGPLLGSM